MYVFAPTKKVWRVCGGCLAPLRTLPTDHQFTKSLVPATVVGAEEIVSLGKIENRVLKQKVMTELAVFPHCYS